MSKTDRLRLCCDRNLYFGSQFKAGLATLVVLQRILNKNFFMIVVVRFEGDLRQIRFARGSAFNDVFDLTANRGTRFINVHN